MAVTGQSDGFGVQVTVDGIREVAAALQQIDPKMKLALLSTIRASVRDVARDAQSLAPRGKTGDLIAKITVKKGRYRGGGLGYKVVSDSREGAILELAGETNPAGLSPQGATLIRTLNASYGSTGRFVWKAWENTKDVALERIEGAIETAQRRIQQKIDGAVK